MSNVAILGAGSAGRALATRLVHGGARVCFGVRDPGAVTAQLTGSLAGVSAVDPRSAVADAEVVLLAVPAPAALRGGPADAVRR